MKLLRLVKRSFPARRRQYDSAIAYDRLLKKKFRKYGGNRDLAFAEAVGSLSVELFREQGDAHVAVLRHHGLTDGMAVFDLGCGCGRTAQALQRLGWKGSFTGTDIIQGFIDELKAKCPGYEARVHRLPSIPKGDAELDLIYHWSVFTHLSPEECFLYLEDSFRALKPGAKTVFSFLEITEPLHHDTFMRRVRELGVGGSPDVLDTFLHRDWIAQWAKEIGFREPEFTAGDDSTHHPPFWQSLVSLQKPD